MSKTLVEYLEELPEPYCTLAIGQIDPNYAKSKINNCCSLMDALFNFCNWDTTNEGYSFWERFYEYYTFGEGKLPVAIGDTVITRELFLRLRHERGLIPPDDGEYETEELRLIAKKMNKGQALIDEADEELRCGDEQVKN